MPHQGFKLLSQLSRHCLFKICRFDISASSRLNYISSQVDMFKNLKPDELEKLADCLIENRCVLE